MQPALQDESCIRALYLQVPALNGVDDFYREALGMGCFKSTDSDSKEYSYAYSETACRIVFRQRDVAPLVDRPNSLYWKVGITVKNLDVAVQYLQEQGVDVSTPRQFRDIGYMSHLKDPSGFTIELLQHGFEGRDQVVANGHPVGVQATLAHITLRVTDIQAAQQFFAGQLGMRLMSVQPVSDYHFCLYFYTWSDEALPVADLESVGNREWLWARPYTFIELQHLQSPGTIVHQGCSDEAGFTGFSYQFAGTDGHLVSRDAVPGSGSQIAGDRG